MQIGFVNFSQEELARKNKVLQMVRDQTAIDELGLGRIRDAFANLMFPGMSTLQRRAKYFAVMPSLFFQATKKNYNYESKNSILITRKEYVTQAVFDLFEQVWVPNDTMIDNTTANVNLHAKMYLTQRLTDDDLGYTLYLGSANATVNAFNKNVEFLLRLHYKRTTNDRIKELLEEITSEHRFVVMDAPNPEASNTRPSNEKELALKRAVGCLRKAVIKPSSKQGFYDIELSVRGKYDSDIQITPLQCKALWQPISNKVEFKELSVHLLSEFYIIRIPSEDNGFIELVAKIRTSGMPVNRDDAIYQSIVTNKDELLNYVAFMLSNRPSEFLFEQHMIMGRNKFANGNVVQSATMPLSRIGH